MFAHDQSYDIPVPGGPAPQIYFKYVDYTNSLVQDYPTTSCITRWRIAVKSLTNYNSITELSNHTVQSDGSVYILYSGDTNFPVSYQFYLLG
jgi:hypothetical protein